MLAHGHVPSEDSIADIFVIILSCHVAPHPKIMNNHERSEFLMFLRTRSFQIGCVLFAIRVQMHLVPPYGETQVVNSNLQLGVC